MKKSKKTTKVKAGKEKSVKPEAAKTAKAAKSSKRNSEGDIEVSYAERLKNSIYEKEIANRYIKSIYNYPLPLKIALPIFSWAIQIRDRKVINLCNKLDFKEIAKDTNFVYLNSNFWRVKHSNIKSGYYYKADDTLKLELIKSTDLMKIANQLKRELKYPPTEIIFYDLDDFNLQQYDKKIFQEVCNNF